jgi:hypothetical protein
VTGVQTCALPISAARHPSESFSRGAFIESGRVKSRCKRAVCVGINTDIGLSRFASIAELPVHGLQELDQFIMALTRPKSIVRIDVYFLVFLGVQSLVKMLNGGICELSTLHKRRPTSPG